MEFICTECLGTICTIHDYPQPGRCLLGKNGLRHACSTVAPKWIQVEEEPATPITHSPSTCPICAEKDEALTSLKHSLSDITTELNNRLKRAEALVETREGQIDRLQDKYYKEIQFENKPLSYWLELEEEIAELKDGVVYEAKLRNAALHWKQLEIDKAHAEIERLDAESANWEETAGRMSDRASRLFGELEEKGEEIGRLQNDVKIMIDKHERTIQALERLPGFSECRFLDDVIEWIKTLEPRQQVDQYGALLSHDPEARAKLDKVLTLLEKKKPAKKKKGAKK